MSHSRKHVQAAVLNETPTLTPEDKIARVKELRGANVCEVEYSTGEKVLSQIPTKFRKLIWIKTGIDNLEYLKLIRKLCRSKRTKESHAAESSWYDTTCTVRGSYQRS